MSHPVSHDASSLVDLAPDNADCERADRVWSEPLRFAFRLAFVCIVLFCFPTGGRVSVLSAFDFPVVDRLEAHLAKPDHAMNVWFATCLFHLHGAVAQYHPTGSGDTTLDYIEVFSFLAISLCTAVFWTALDRGRPNYATLYAWLRLLVRYTMGATLLSYGLIKIFPLQFSSPSFATLNERYGDSSPMHLLWTFMGASAGYRIFAGCAETIPGILLFFRRTTPLGALLGAAVMSNVVALNFFYDVPVKIYSVQIVLLCIFLLLPEFGALARVLVLRRASLPVLEPRVPLRRPWMRWTATATKVVFMAMWYYSAYGIHKQASASPAAKPNELTGIWKVDSFVIAQQEAPATSPSGRWLRLSAGRFGDWRAEMTYDSERRYASSYSGNTVSLRNAGADDKASPAAVLTWRKIDADHIMLAGTIDGKPVTIKLHGSLEGKSLLMNRGFHWINEDPFQR